VRLTDTHCHLDLAIFDPDREAVLERAALAGVERIVIPGISLASSQRVLEMSGTEPMLFAAVGVHPSEAGTWDERTRQELKTLASATASAQTADTKSKTKSKIVAIGEIGLDYYWDGAPHELQLRVLVEQLDLAAELTLPVIVHFREHGDAVDGACATDLLEVLEGWVARLQAEGNPLAARPGVLHSFSGSSVTARRAIGLNFLLGVTGPVTHRVDRQALIAGLPLESLVIETDAPYLAPVPMRGKRNEPAFVALIADKIALLQHCSPEFAAARTTANANRLFGWEN
jgi:TatD DNase family protein